MGCADWLLIEDGLGACPKSNLRSLTIAVVQEEDEERQAGKSPTRLHIGQ